MSKKFVKANPFLKQSEISANFHGQEVYKSNTWRPYYRYEERDELGRLTGVYYADEYKKPMPRKLVVKYSDDSKRPYAIWFCYDGSEDMHFCFKYKKNGDLDTIYFWGNGGNTCNEFHYKKAIQTNTVKTGRRVTYKESWPVITINGHTALFLRELPDMTKVAGFYYTHEKDPFYPQTLIENDCAIHEWLGISAEALYDKYPKEKPRPFDPKVDGYWVRKMMEIQNAINRPQLGE